MIHHDCWSIESRTNRTLPSPRATFTPPVGRLRAVAWLLLQLVQLLRFWAGRFGASRMSSEQSRFLPSLGSWQSPSAWEVMVLDPARPNAQTARGSFGSAPATTSPKRIVFELPSEICWIPIPFLADGVVQTENGPWPL